MHSCCRISGLPQAERSPRGPSEYDKHPAFKLRRATQAYDKRLSIQLAQLDQRCREITSRMTHSMRATSQALKQIQNSSDDEGSECLYGNARKLPTIPNRSSYAANVNASDDECNNNVRSVLTDIINDSDDFKVSHYESKTNKSPRNIGSKGYVSENYAHKLPPIPNINRDHKLPKIVENNHEKKKRSSSNKSKRKNLQFGSTASTSNSDSCCFGASKGSHKCLHFPCHRPETYHSLGFRLDGSSTQKWMTWAELKKTKIDVPNPNTASNVRGASLHASENGSELRRWCSLPMDFESRKQRLKDDIEKRRAQNLAKKPKCWETNYGEMTPYKVLAYPVRLHPLQMTTK